MRRKGISRTDEKGARRAPFQTTMMQVWPAGKKAGANSPQRVVLSDICIAFDSSQSHQMVLKNGITVASHHQTVL